MSKQLGGLVLGWSVAIMLVAGLVSSAWAGQSSHQASRSGATADSIVVAAVGGTDNLRTRAQAMNGDVNQRTPLPVLCWELQNQDIYIYRHNMEGLNWHQIRDQRAIRKNARQNQKLLKLNLMSLAAGPNASQPPSPDLTKQTRLLMRDPDGYLSSLSPMIKKEELVFVPDDKEINGRYLLSAQLNMGKMDYDRDGLDETVSLYAKQFVIHYREDLQIGSVPDVFFNDAGLVAFEIGPVVNNAKNKFGGAMQRPHREYEMMVKYKNRPLPGARVSVYVEGGGWQRRFITDADGIFAIMPTDDRISEQDWQKYIYVAEHFDAEDRSYHIATFPVIVNKLRAEWRSKAIGFEFWAISGSALTLLLVAGLSWRKRFLDKKSLVVFESCRIKKD